MVESDNGVTVTFRGHGVFSWDAAQHCYALQRFDTMGMPPNEFRGNFEGRVLSMTSKSHQGVSRATFDFGQEGKYTFRMEVSQDGKKWQTFVEGNYDRESA